MTSGTTVNTIVTSIYGLTYVPERAVGAYKSFPLLTETLRSQIFDKYQYVIYTNKASYDSFNLAEYFPQPNVTIKFRELNQPLYTDIIKPIKDAGVAAGELWERLYSVDNYIEVILNKLEILLEESKIESNGNIIWLDAGLFGTSCHDGWRDYMRDELIYGKTLFLDSIFKGIEECGFIATRGNRIQINYEVSARLAELAKTEIKLIPGCLFGGTKEKNIEILSNYKSIFLEYINRYQHLISEQELLSVLTCNKEVCFYEFDEWTDLQKAFLKILNLYDESKYSATKCY